MDYVQNLDPSKLLLGLTALSFVTSPFQAPPYNLPIMLFGSLAQQQDANMNSDNQASQTFAGLLGGSIVFDIIWMTSNSQNVFIRLLTVLQLLLKVPTFFAFGLALRQRGGQFSGLNIRGGDLGGATVWDSMPGSFGAVGNGYQNLDEERPPRAAPSMPTAHPAPPPSQPPAATTAPYQTV
ncbi:hypothetical protein MIND_00485800 [Mycena indigotica]|uniref:Uncharacterized protein n=1 Tax=Mycena indigotica TaxID=2126181 RepID=A0A8H6W6S4_9AGAR|nr:uncharacterized protein MIND_00485800 [Mycena indigotica]KAF7306932.1 hypothetical protein MIND_00485800 [Mycena indigotica]